MKKPYGNVKETMLRKAAALVLAAGLVSPALANGSAEERIKAAVESNTAGKVTVVEVEHIVPTGTFDPDQIHTPGIYVDRIVLTVPEKRIEQRTVRQRETV